MSAMRGIDEMQASLFTTVKLDDFVPADHPLRPIRLLVNDALKRLKGLFSVIYADTGRPSIAPEKLLRALLFEVLLGAQRAHADGADALQPAVPLVRRTGDQAPCGTTRCSRRSRDRLLEHEVVEAFFAEVMSLTDQRGLLSREHFSVDGTLIQAWASHKSFRAKDGSDNGPPASGGGNADTDWKGKRRSNDTHESSKGYGRTSVQENESSHPVLPRPHPDGEPLRAVDRRCGRSCARGRPGRASSCRPARPCTTKRFFRTSGPRPAIDGGSRLPASIHVCCFVQANRWRHCAMPRRACSLATASRPHAAEQTGQRRAPQSVHGTPSCRAVATDGVDCHVSGNLVEQIRQSSVRRRFVQCSRPSPYAPCARCDRASFAMTLMAVSYDLSERIH